MICPHCAHEIDDKLIAAYLASKGGSKSRRVLTSEQSAAMCAARKDKKAETERARQNATFKIKLID